MQPAAEELPAIIQEVLEPTPGYWTPESEPQPANTNEHAEQAKELPPPVQREDATPAPITDEDVEAVLEQGGLKALAAEGFDPAELQELDDTDPLEQDISDDPLVSLQLSTW